MLKTSTRVTALQKPAVLFLLWSLSYAGLPAHAAEADKMEINAANCPVWGIYEGFASGDLEAVLGYMAADVRWLHPGEPDQFPYAGEFVGREGVRQFFEAALDNLENLGQEIESCFTQGDQVALIGQETYRVRATGKQYFTRWVHLYTLEDGLVAGFEEFADTAAIAAAFRQDDD